MDADHGDLHLPVHRRDGQERAVPAARVAARLDGRPDADLRADPRRDDGDRRHLHGRAHVAAVRAVGHRAELHPRIGAITALFMGFLGIIQNDIKRVVAYSTLSQLGYMTVALGASAYSVAVFHLMTHAFFKALLFLGAGSVIIGMHHDQDIRNMGGLRKYMPITWITSLLGSLALIGTPLFAGFYSKDSIIEAVHASHLPGAGFAYFAVIAACSSRRSTRSACTSWSSTARSASATSPSRASTTTTTATADGARAARVALGRDGAAGAAGDPVGGHRLPDDRADAATATSSRTRSSSTLEQHPAMEELARGIPRRHRDGAARPDLAAVLAGARRRGHRLCVLHGQARRSRRPSRPRVGSVDRDAREQVLLGLVQREGARAPAHAGSGSGLWKGGDQA